MNDGLMAWCLVLIVFYWIWPEALFWWMVCLMMIKARGLVRSVVCSVIHVRDWFGVIEVFWLCKCFRMALSDLWGGAAEIFVKFWIGFLCGCGEWLIVGMTLLFCQVTSECTHMLLKITFWKRGVIPHHQSHCVTRLI